MSTDLSKLLQVNPLFFSLISVTELVDFYTPAEAGSSLKGAGGQEGLTQGAIFANL